MKILGVRVDKTDMAEALEMARRYIDGEQYGRHIITLNAEIAYLAQKEPRLLKIIEKADLVTADGAGVLWASRELGDPLPERVTGIDLMEALIREAAGRNWRVYLLGADLEVLKQAVANLREKHPGIRIAGSHHGYFRREEEAPMIGEIKASAPDILFVALGAPKQEYWIDENKEESGAKVLLGVGGSFDVIAGQVRRAPLVFRKLQLEWLWRLLLNPSRFCRMTALPRFMWAVKKEKWRKETGKGRR